MSEDLVDSNVILDVVTEDPHWFEWSAEQLESLSEDHTLVINPLIYSEISVGFERIETLDEALPSEYFRRDPLPWQAGFLAGKCFQQYRRAGSIRIHLGHCKNGSRGDGNRLVRRGHLIKIAFRYPEVIRVGLTDAG